MKAKTSDTRRVMHDVLDLYEGLLIPFMKIRRDLPFPTEPERQETDAEHTFMLVMAALTVAEKLQLPLDHGLIARYALIHDLVEAHAGDVSARSTEQEQQVKVDREHEAFLIIRRRYEKSAPWIPKLIEAYEARTDDEAKFVYALDKQMGCLTWMSGHGKAWHHYHPDSDSYHRVVGRLRKKASIYPPLLELFDTVHAELDQRRLTFTEDSKT